MKLRNILIFLIILLAGTTALFFLYSHNGKNEKTEIRSKPEKADLTDVKKIDVADGLTYGLLMGQNGVPTSTSQQIFDAAKEVYDLSRIRSGRSLILVYEKNTGRLIKFIYPIDTEEELWVSLPAAASTTPAWLAQRVPIAYEIKIKTVEGEIESSLYESALKQEIDERAIIAFADTLQWTIDFAWEVRKGDKYKFIYEERYRDGQYAMPGKVLAGKFINAGQIFEVFYYQRTDGSEGYFNGQGDSAQKIFLKAPLAFKYISSGFTTGWRYVEAFDVSTGHRAVDYAASLGTPIRSVGDGTVVFAGWNGAYGRMVKVRHNEAYQTNYGHMSKIAVKSGQKVVQGQTIGYVGSTGFSTGPHLHYEMQKSGTKINPLKEIFPATQGISPEEKEAYLSAISDWKNKLSE
jgi:murein DD-endopeptidase MepM/ murein hydrolase activator NlpD